LHDQPTVVDRAHKELDQQVYRGCGWQSSSFDRALDDPGGHGAALAPERLRRVGELGVIDRGSDHGRRDATEIALREEGRNGIKVGDEVLLQVPRVWLRDRDGGGSSERGAHQLRLRRPPPVDRVLAGMSSRRDAGGAEPADPALGEDLERRDEDRLVGLGAARSSRSGRSGRS
jgi:hypothetical protein